MTNRNYTPAILILDSILLAVFILLHIINVLNWSWWWILSPLWLNITIVLVQLIIHLLKK
ncbi:MAG TPA: hypothetical protein VN958_07760 [Chitinophagaceae bacterium]|nr:hypothetical protein [Chitinophagaceae bacterium]